MFEGSVGFQFAGWLRCDYLSSDNAQVTWLDQTVIHLKRLLAAYWTLHALYRLLGLDRHLDLNGLDCVLLNSFPDRPKVQLLVCRG